MARWKLLKIAGDGLCFFRSIVQFQYAESMGELFDYEDETKHAESFRDELIKFMKQHPEIQREAYLSVHGGVYNINSINEIPMTELKKFVDTRAREVKAKDWAETSEVDATSLFLKRPIDIYNPGEARVLHTRNPGGFTSSPIRLELENAVHYEVRVPEHVLQQEKARGFIASGHIYTEGCRRQAADDCKFPRSKKNLNDIREYLRSQTQNDEENRPKKNKTIVAVPKIVTIPKAAPKPKVVKAAPKPKVAKAPPKPKVAKAPPKPKVVKAAPKPKETPKKANPVEIPDLKAMGFTNIEIVEIKKAAARIVGKKSGKKFNLATATPGEVKTYVFYLNAIVANLD